MASLTKRQNTAVAHQHRAAIYAKGSRYARAQAACSRLRLDERIYLLLRSTQLQHDAAYHYQMARVIMEIE